MLPPQLHQSVLSLRPHLVALPARSITLTHSRSFWGWRRSCNDYSSHLDPMFHRFARSRTLKTRAKLLDKLRRRGRWDWDASQRPFFSGKQLRLASHWNGSRPRWMGNGEEVASDQKKAVAEEQDGYELSDREKEWKDQMEWMRKRVEKDPYEFVFGRRFEPFWSPLVPNWMREEMGLKFGHVASPSTTVHVKASTGQANAPPTQPIPVKPIERKPEAPKKDVEVDTSDSPNGQLTNYSYASTSSTSWDSWTKKARREEWDSVSGKTRRFEYDPISNRMVKVDLPKVKEPAAIEPAVAEPIAPSTATPKSVEATGTKSTGSEAINTLVQTLETVRKSIPIPTQSTMTTTAPNPVYFPSLLNTSMTRHASRPAALANLPEEPASEQDSNLEKLTANDVRASMGKAKPRPLQPAVDRLQSRQLPVIELDDSAAHESTGERRQTAVPNGWSEQAERLQAERVRRTSGAAPTLSEGGATVQQPKLTHWIRKSQESSRPAAGKTMESPRIDVVKLKETLEAGASQRETVASPPGKVLNLFKLQEMLEAEVSLHKTRMHAHEAGQRTGPVQPAAKESVSATAHAGTSAAGTSAAGLSSAGTSAARTSDGEVERYKSKLRSQREELNVAFKQSSLHAEMQLERIRKLEAEISRLQGKLQQSGSRLPEAPRRESQPVRTLQEELDKFSAKKTHREATMTTEPTVEATRAEGDMCVNVVKHAKDSSKWYKKPAALAAAPAVMPQEVKNEKVTAAEEQKSRDAALVRQVRQIYEAAYGVIDMGHRQGLPAAAELPKASDGSSQKSLRKHPQVVEVESDVDLGSALADFEAKQEYGYQRDGLEAEVRDRAPMDTLGRGRERFVPPAPSKTSERATPPAAAAKRSPPTTASPSATTAAAAPAPAPPSPATPPIQWADPPALTLLLHSRTTDVVNSFNLTSPTAFADTNKSDTPVSTSQVLAQLTQPALFVPLLAELQAEGFHPVWAKDRVIALRQVAQPEAKESNTKKPLVNPIDGMTASPAARARAWEPSTGSFASPTGFVGDRWEEASSTSTPPSPAPAPASASVAATAPRPQRQERVFSGTRSVDLPGSVSKHERRLGSKRLAREARREERRRFRGWRARAAWALSVGVGAAGLAYGVGAVAEAKERRAW